jgi:hypothetical protein
MILVAYKDGTVEKATDAIQAARMTLSYQQANVMCESQSDWEAFKEAHRALVTKRIHTGASKGSEAARI